MTVNVENVKFAIEVMKQAKNLNMCMYQDGREDVDTIEELHACGNTACFIGYLVLTDTYKNFVKSLITNQLQFETDGTISYGVLEDLPLDNEPKYYLSEFLGIGKDQAYGFIFGDNEEVDNFYPVDFEDVKPEHVIEKLEALLCDTKG